MTCVLRVVIGGSVIFCFRNVGSVIATLTAIVSVIVMVQTKHDVVNARLVSPLIFVWPVLPCTVVSCLVYAVWMWTFLCSLK